MSKRKDRRFRWALVAAALVIASATGLAAPANAQSDSQPGDLVRLDALPVGWGGMDRGYKLTYRTVALDGRPTTATGLIFLPDGHAPDGGWPIVAWDHGTNGLAPRCGLTSSAGAPYDAPALRRVNRAGYAAVAPDYLGLSPESPGVHPYQNTRTEATVTIDLVRAARRAFADLSTRWAVMGVSQGGGAALSTGHLAATYAPELDFRATAALAPASHIEQLMRLARPGMPAVPALNGMTGVVAAVLAGMSANSSGFDIGSYLPPEGRRIVAEISTRCVAEWPATVGDRSLGELLARPLDDPAALAFLHAYLAIPTGGYRQPVFIGQGVADTSVPLPLTLALLAEFAAAGTRYEFATFDADHDTIMGDGFDAGLRFVQRALNAN
ncbi:lipase family protein [Nocardia sp. CDC159]|uniref:Lipase family protein n=1 Tax=Nocardia pulmonis TaxID=2951408 RepID=A0A9X2IYB6_9NOCA|nr:MULTISPECIES: lipase family protein [Nocardia]MCM6775479.1 lipase family protein [Nocardia pulmonis]MCM6787787.1 lipase family protein [Nocardia sp. CDC159]